MRRKIRDLCCWLAALSLAVMGCSDDTTRPEVEILPSEVWACSAGGSDPDTGTAVAIDGSGNVIVIGEFNGSATFGSTTLTSAGSRDVFVAKYDVAGALLWAQSTGGSEYDGVSGVSVDGSGNVLVAGYFSGSTTIGGTTLTSAGGSDIYIAKFDAEGTLLWAHSAGSSDVDEARGVATDESGGVIVTGYFTNTVTFGETTLTSTGHFDVFVAKYDAAGALVWANSGGGESIDQGFGVAADGSGNVIVTGFFHGSATFGETTLTGLPGNMEWDVFVAKYDPEGALLWARSADSALPDIGMGVATDGLENVIVAGIFQGSADFASTTLVSAGGSDVFIAKYDAAGTLLWAQSSGGAGADQLGGIAVDGSGNVFVTGAFVGSASFGDVTLTGEGQDVFVAKYDVTGASLWAGSAGGPQLDGGNGVAVDGSGKVVITGEFKETATFGGTTLTSAGSWDVFIASMRSSGF